MAKKEKESKIMNEQIISRKVFDGESFANVNLTKTITLPEIDSLQKAQEVLGNNAEAFLAAVKRGVEASLMESAEKSTDGWFIEKDGKATDEVFSGTMLSRASVNGIVLMVAKTVYNYSKSQPLEARKKAKSAAIEWIKKNPEFKAGLLRQAASGELVDSSDDSDDDTEE